MLFGLEMKTEKKERKKEREREEKLRNSEPMPTTARPGPQLSHAQVNSDI